MKQKERITSASVPLSGGARSQVIRVRKELALELERLKRLEQRYKNAPSIFGVLFVMAIAFVAGYLIGAQP